LSNQKYEITDIAHVEYPFLHRIRALRDIGNEIKAGSLGGFVESEENLSFEPDDEAWIFDDAISCNNATVDKGSFLRGAVIACENAYISGGAKLFDYARAEDHAYMCGGVMRGRARVSNCARILLSSDKMMQPALSDSCIVYGTVSGNVRVEGQTVILSNEEIWNESPDMLVIRETGRYIIRDPSRDKLAPLAETTMRYRDVLHQKSMLTKSELRLRLQQGLTLNDLLEFVPGQDCEIFKADKFYPGNVVIYVPDVYLNHIPLDRPITDLEELAEVLSNCYTGQDFINECSGDVEKAERLFCYCDWQHPSSAVDELADDEEE